MAIYHCSVKILRRSQGRSSTAAAAYRAGELIRDERTGEAFDYQRRRGVAHTEIFLPKSCTWEGDREQLWNANELKNKRADAQVAREFTLALPHELTEVQRLAAAQRFCKLLAERYQIVVDLAIHRPHDKGDTRNHHAHILTSTNRINPDGSFGNKARELDGIARNMNKEARNQKGEIDFLREAWANIANDELREAGLSVRIDHRSYDELELPFEPEEHEGPVVTQMRRRGIETEQSRRNVEVRGRNAEVRQVIIELGESKVEIRQLHDERKREQLEGIDLSELVAEQREVQGALLAAKADLDTAREMVNPDIWQSNDAWQAYLQHPLHVESKALLRQISTIRTQARRQRHNPFIWLRAWSLEQKLDTALNALRHLGAQAYETAREWGHSIARQAERIIPELQGRHDRLRRELETYNAVIVAKRVEDDGVALQSNGPDPRPMISALGSRAAIKGDAHGTPDFTSKPLTSHSYLIASQQIFRLSIEYERTQEELKKMPIKILRLKRELAAVDACKIRAVIETRQGAYAAAALQVKRLNDERSRAAGRGPIRSLLTPRRDFTAEINQAIVLAKQKQRELRKALTRARRLIERKRTQLRFKVASLTAQLEMLQRREIEIPEEIERLQEHAARVYKQLKSSGYDPNTGKPQEVEDDWSPKPELKPKSEFDLKKERRKL